MRGHELEMIEHWMAMKGAELVLEPQQNGPRLRPLEQHLALALIGLDAVEPDQEIGLPGGAAELAIGDGFEPDLLLLADHRRDRAVLDSPPLSVADLAALVSAARLLEGCRPQQAADVVGAKGRLGALHRELLIQAMCDERSRPAASTAPSPLVGEGARGSAEGEFNEL
jgi:hypothetical protein